jgi:predicted metalloprotease
MIPNVRARVMGLVGVLAVFMVGCGAADPGVTATRSRAGAGGGGGGQLIPTESTVTGETVPVEPTYEIIPNVVDFGSSKPPQDYDGFLTNAFGDIQEFWNLAYPEAYGAPFELLQGSIFAAYPERQEPIPGCGTPSSSYEDVAGYGAFYCPAGDFMAYDDASLLPKLVAELGKEAVAIVLAHEFGHAVQMRANNLGQPVVLKEQQADCFAGAWAAHVASGGSDLIKFDDADVRGGIIAMIYVRDPIEGDGLANPQAHGTGFDRVGAFQEGFEGGVLRCKTFFDENRIDTLIDILFNKDDPNAGNLPLVDDTPDPERGPDDIVTLIPRSLDFFWTDLAAQNGVPFTPPTFTPFASAGPFPTCDGIDPGAYAGNVLFCPGDNTIYWDQDAMLTLSLDPLTGDMSVGYLFSNAYSDAIQTALASQRTGEPRALFNDCLTGAWVAFIVPPLPDDREDRLELSAGDLDEAIVTAVGRSDATADTNVSGVAFEKVDAFRSGVQGGLNICEDVIQR